MNAELTTDWRLNSILDSLRSGSQDYHRELKQRFARIEPELLAFLPEPDRFGRLEREFNQLERQFPDPQRRPPLYGLPVGVKDILRVVGFETHAGSKLPAQALMGGEAESVRQLREAGALVLGKTVTTEFAYFAPGPTRNPHNPQHTPGGSSSGSAAAVGAGLAPLALGTQTIGSINRPAAFCGVVGFKPSYARISTAGVIPLSPSLDHIGYFTADAAGAAAIAPILLADWSAAGPIDQPTLGVPVGPYLDRASDSGRQNFESALGKLRHAGLEVREVPAMADYDQIAERHRLILAAEAAEVHREWFQAYGELYDPKTAELIRTGQAISAAELETARSGRDRLRQELQVLMQQQGVDLWISPSAPGVAPEGLASTGDPSMNLPWTHAGLPTITLTSGWSPGGLPFGIQLTAGWQRDEFLLGCAQLIEPSLDAGDRD